MIRLAATMCPKPLCDSSDTSFGTAVCPDGATPTGPRKGEPLRASHPRHYAVILATSPKAETHSCVMALAERILHNPAPCQLDLYLFSSGWIKREGVQDLDQVQQFLCRQEARCVSCLNPSLKEAYSQHFQARQAGEKRKTRIIIFTEKSPSDEHLVAQNLLRACCAGGDSRECTTSFFQIDDNPRMRIFFSQLRTGFQQLGAPVRPLAFFKAERLKREGITRALLKHIDKLG